jgi:hypothetical protein
MHMKMNLLWKFNQWWSSIPQILTKRTITSHLNWTYWSQKINKTYVVVNPRPSLWQVQQCGCVKPVNGIPTLPSFQLDLRQQCISTNNKNTQIGSFKSDDTQWNKRSKWQCNNRTTATQLYLYRNLIYL